VTPPTAESAEVLAAGGVVVREGCVALVHRPRYDDWSLPKGKLDKGEEFEDAALREVREETGIRCKLGRHLGDTTYKDHKEREKLVRYFEMHPEDGEFTPNDEVDELRWVPIREAADGLSYEFDRELVSKLS
jgi:8-oxo-dGTP diphosphatase